MKSLVTFLILSTLIVSCNSSPKPATADTPWYDSIPFGTVQPLLEQNALGEKLTRIDSLVKQDSLYTIYYITDKSTYSLTTGKFDLPTIVLKGYKPNGDHSGVTTIMYSDRSVSKCKDSACTLVIDTIQLNRSVSPYFKPS